nr:hypothetical protein [uncultured Desulfobulbus sp.]
MINLAQRIVLLVIAAPIYLSIFDEITHRYILFADASTREFSNALYYLFGMSHGFLLWAAYLAFNCILEIVTYFLDRFCTPSAIEKEAASDSTP